jgi:hypothetical protein
MKYIFNYLLPYFALLSPKKRCLADQPVHCLRQDIYGQWTFKISKDTQTVDLFQASDVCTHKMPNGVQVITPDYHFMFQQYDLLKVDLKDNYEAEAYYCQDEKACA